MEQQLQVVLHTKISSTHRKTEKNVEKMGETGAQGPLSSTGRWVAQKKTADNCLVAEFPVTASMSTVISTLDVSNVSNIFILFRAPIFNAVICGTAWKCSAC